jgi:hypothetical protein
MLAADDFQVSAIPESKSNAMLLAGSASVLLISSKKTRSVKIIVHGYF